MRVEGWEALLASHFNARPFEWGRNDCALFAADWVRKCTGTDHAKGWRGKYSTEKGAKIKLTRAGFASVEAIADSCLASRPLGFASRGDVVLHPQGALGVCNGLKSHFLTAEGMTTFDTLACTKAWGVD